MGETVCLELIFQILLLLPVKSLLRFRCVSKLWCAMIDSEDFIKAHLQRSLKNNTNLHVILSRLSFIYPSRTCAYSVPRDEEDFANSSMMELHKPLTDSTIHSSCNGLLWLSKYHHHHEAIWNPFTRKYRKFPSITKIAPPLLNGFGCDPINNDYKVVSILDTYTRKGFRTLHDLTNQVWIYSLTLNSWRRVEDFPYKVYRCNIVHGKFVDGALHWFVKNKLGEPSELLVGFNLAFENFFSLPFPNELVGCEKFLDVVEGCLCICVYNNVETGGVWMMKEYGVGESWTKLCSIRDLVEGSSRVQLVACTNLDEKLLLPINIAGNINFSKNNGFNLMSYDVQETGRMFSVCEMPCNYDDVTMCVESLIPV